MGLQSEELFRQVQLRDLLAGQIRCKLLDVACANFCVLSPEQLHTTKELSMTKPQPILYYWGSTHHWRTWQTGFHSALCERSIQVNADGLATNQNWCQEQTCVNHETRQTKITKKTRISKNTTKINKLITKNIAKLINQK